MKQRRYFKLNCRGRLVELGKTTCVMGILNITPDSFSGDGILRDKSNTVQLALKQAKTMLKHGARMIDVGGESTRPGARPVSAAAEIKRVVPVIHALARETDAVVSVDTYKPEVAAAALDAGAHILNVIKGAPVSGQLLRLAKRYGAAIILMHMRGTPLTMQRFVKYHDVVDDVIRELKKSVEKCRSFGLNDDAIVVDPGIGFAKTAQQNLRLLQGLSSMASLNCPVLVGTSRKSFIGKVLGLETGRRLMGSAATVALAVSGGAHIIRVHDVKDMLQVARMTDAILNVTTDMER